MEQNTDSLDLIELLFQNINELGQMAEEARQNSMLVAKSLKDLEVYYQDLIKSIQGLNQEKSALLCQLDKVKMDIDLLEKEKQELEKALANEHERVIELQRNKHEVIVELRKAQKELDKINDDLDMARRLY
ncbi:hypothetical protein [Desulfitibacter alkalitolerans]|uniref:hypothetical protein n=1 Tax=Desulfitibacter alkalitolerans TaxID=264641 RepID=UPI0004892B69|nr:hypothetical protein [Desulfitibacter alkalitolerans]